MADYNDTPIGSGYNSNSAINTELSQIATAIRTKMDKTGTTMSGDLDMNSNNILNANAISTQAFSIAGEQVTASGSVTTTLPAQVGKERDFLSTDGTTAFWTPLPLNVDTVAIMIAMTDLSVGDIIVTKEYATDIGTMGGGTYDTVLTSSVTPNTFNIITSTDDATLSFVLRLEVISNVMQFGAYGDDTHEDAGAIQAAIDAGNAVYIPAGVFKFSTGLSNPNLVPNFGPGNLKFYGSGEHAYVFGDETVSNLNPTAMPSNLWIERVVTDWSDQFGGLVLENSLEMSLTVHIHGFWHGLKLRGLGRGCNYNKITIDSIEQCQSNLVLHSDVGGSCNQSTFIGGRFANLQATSSANDIHGVEFISDSTSTPNGHLFLNPSFELNNTGAGSTSCFHGSGSKSTTANRNYAVGFRMEDTDFLLSGKGMTDNKFESTSDNNNIATVTDIINGDTADDDRILSDNQITLSRGNMYSDRPVEIARIGRQSVIHNEDGSTNEYITAPSNGAVWDESAATWTKRIRATALHDSFQLDVGSDVWGVLLDMSEVGEDQIRKLSLKLHLAANGGRIAAVCFDSSFVLLSADGDCSLAFDVAKGYYRPGVDSTILTSEFTVTFSSNVKYVFMGVARGTASTDLNNMSIFALAQSDIKIVYDTDLYDDISQANGGGANLHPVFDTPVPRSEVIPEVPNAGNSYPDGLFVRNDTVVEAGSASSKYVIQGWIYDADVTIWYEQRALTGN